jgi:hypothetical protein
MAGPQAEIYTVNYILEGRDVPFSVEIDKNKIVNILKDKIKEKMHPILVNVAASDLTLFKIDIFYDQDFKNNLEAKIRALPDALGPLTKLENVFNRFPEGYVHILVQVPITGEFLRTGIRMNSQANNPTQHTSLPHLYLFTLDAVGKRKRSPSNSQDINVKRVKVLESIPSITPSSVKLKDITHHGGIDVTYNRPKASCTTIPIALLHQVFANFLEDYRRHEPTERDNKWLTELRHAMLQEYAEETLRCSEFRQIFEKHTGIKIPDASIPGSSYRTDGHYDIAGHYLLITEGKNEWVGISADPQLQAFLYYIQSAKSNVDKVSKGDSLPCLIIYYVGKCTSAVLCNALTNSTIGSLIGFAGAVTAGKPQFEVLTPLFDLATNQHDALALQPVARALGAVRAGLKSLEEYYAEPRLSPNPAFPSRNYYKSRDGTRVDFDYEERLDDDKLLFRILTKQSKQSLVLKFTQKYSEEAHAHCASHGIAPELHAVERLGGGWMMVVMEYLDNTTYTALRALRGPKDDLYIKVTNAVAVLHQGNFVHGDIRDVNVMTRVLETGVRIIKLVDFDWAGPDGVACYPANVNHEGIRRPKDAKDGKLVTKEHDRIMVEFLFS